MGKNKLEIDFEAIQKIRDKRNGLYEKLKSTGRHIRIFGAGVYAKKLDRYFRSIGIRPSGFTVDDVYFEKTAKWGGMGTRCIPMSSALKLRDMIIVYGIGDGYSSRYHFISQRLNDLIKAEGEEGIELIVLDDFWLGGWEQISESFYKAHESQFQETYGMLGDDLSKSIMTAYINSSISLDANGLERFWTDCKNDYELELLFSQIKDGIVVACGAYDGKSIMEMNSYLHGSHELIALECDKMNYETLCNNVKGCQNIRPVQLGVWDKITALEMESNGSRSVLVEKGGGGQNGGGAIKVADIDSLVNGKCVSVITMDIEGSEMRGLKGAAATVKRDRPALAVRVYHKPEDFITIPQYIRALNPDYKFYMRYNHTAAFLRANYETTLYAI